MTASKASVAEPKADPSILTAGVWLAIIGAGILMALGRSMHYLLFHTIAELVAIAVSISIFTLAWATRQHLRNGYLVILGAAYITIATVDIFHTLTFKGMNLLPDVTTNHPTQFWLSARFIEAVALCLAPLFVRRQPNFSVAALAFAVPGALLGIAVFADVLPTTHVEGVGLTSFKIVSEFVIIAVLVAALVMLTKMRAEFPRQVHQLLSASILLAIATEFCFIHYVGFYDFVNELGHYFRFVSVVLAYLALVVTGVRQPANLLYRQLISKDEALIATNAELALSEANLKRAQAVAGIGSWHLDIPANQLTWSDQTYRMFGVPLGTPRPSNPSPVTSIPTTYPRSPERGTMPSPDGRLTTWCIASWSTTRFGGYASGRRSRATARVPRSPASAPCRISRRSAAPKSRWRPIIGISRTKWRSAPTTWPWPRTRPKPLAGPRASSSPT
jgi:hypothetical protein